MGADIGRDMGSETAADMGSAARVAGREMVEESGRLGREATVAAAEKGAATAAAEEREERVVSVGVE